MLDDIILSQNSFWQDWEIYDKEGSYYLYLNNSFGLVGNYYAGILQYLYVDNESLVLV